MYTLKYITHLLNKNKGFYRMQQIRGFGEWKISYKSDK